MKPTEHFISQHDTAWLKLKSSQNMGDSCCKKQSEKGHCPFPMCDFQWAVKVHFKNCHALSNHLLLSRCFVQQCFYFFLFIHFSLILIRQLSDGWFSLVISWESVCQSQHSKISYRGARDIFITLQSFLTSCQHHKYYSMLVTDRHSPAFQPGGVWRWNTQQTVKTLFLLCHIHSLCVSVDLHSV